MASYAERFAEYFRRDVAQTAAQSLAESAEIEFQIQSSDGNTVETFTFGRKASGNQVTPGPATDPQVAFIVTPQAADQILSDPAEDIGTIGVNIAKLAVSSDANRRVSVKLKTGFLTLWNKGYFGVLTAGGSQFAAFLASKGLNGMGAIKDALGKMRKS